MWPSRATAIALLRKCSREKSVDIANVSTDALRWGTGVKIVAIGWLAPLFSAWLQGEITTEVAYGAIATGAYWSVGSFLESAGRG
jgi:hypothetical protein